jgi:enterochelin esterase family protein
VERWPSRRIAALARCPQREAEFWRAVTAEGTPLVEPLEGDPGHAAVTFLWRGGPRTRAVLVLPNSLYDPQQLARNLMSRVPGTDVWHWTVRMRTDWRATYTLCVDEGQGPPSRPVRVGSTAGGTAAGTPGGTAGGAAGGTAAGAMGSARPVRAGGEGPAHLRWLRGQARRDPLGRTPFPRRPGGPPLSVVVLPDAPHALEPGAEARPVASPGTVNVETLRSAALRNWRRVWSWAPAGRPPVGVRLPVLVLLRGEVWEPQLRVSALLDRLVAEGRIPPLVALMPDALDRDSRWSELTCNDLFATFLADELLPWAAGRWPVSTDPERVVLAGQGLGGLAASHAALRRPDRFGAVLAQSGAFWWPLAPGDRSRGEEWLTGRVAASPALPVRFRVSAGLHEWTLLPAVRRLRDVLLGKGYDVSYREFNGGHDYVCWREDLASGLESLLGRR